MCARVPPALHSSVRQVLEPHCHSIACGCMVSTFKQMSVDMFGLLDCRSRVCKIIDESSRSCAPPGSSCRTGAGVVRSTNRCMADCQPEVLQTACTHASALLPAQGLHGPLAAVDLQARLLAGACSSATLMGALCGTAIAAPRTASGWPSRHAPTLSVMQRRILKHAQTMACSNAFFSGTCRNPRRLVQCAVAHHSLPLRTPH